MQNQLLSEILAFSALFIAGQGTGILLLLFSFAKKNTVFYLLVIYIALNCYMLVFEYFSHRQIPLPQIFNHLSSIYILKGGAFYLYVKALTTPGFRIEWKHAVHLLPLCLAWFAYRLDFLGSPRLITAYLFLFYYLLLVGYCIAAARLMPDYGRYIRGHFSSIGKINLDWLYKLIIVYLFSSLVFLVLRVVELGALINNDKLDFVYVNNAIVFFICFYLIALGGYRQELTEIGPSLSTASDTDSDTDNKPDAATKSADAPPLDKGASKKIWQTLNAHMRKEEPYLDEELNLYQLAERIGTSPRHLSQVLNALYGQSFYDFVNGYRAEKAKVLIEDAAMADKPMLEIGVEAGFANKMTFYKYFKKHFSKTPLQYKKALDSEPLA